MTLPNSGVGINFKICGFKDHLSFQFLVFLILLINNNFNNPRNVFRHLIPTWPEETLRFMYTNR